MADLGRRTQLDIIMTTAGYHDAGAVYYTHGTNPDGLLALHGDVGLMFLVCGW